MIGEAMIVLGVALLFSSWTRPFLAGVFTFGYFVMGRNMYLLREYLDAAKGPLAEPGPLRNIANGFTYIVPDLDVFNVSGEIALGIDVHGGYVLASTGYAVAFTAVFLALMTPKIEMVGWLMPPMAWIRKAIGMASYTRRSFLVS